MVHKIPKSRKNVSTLKVEKFNFHPPFNFQFLLRIFTGDLERLRRYWMTGACLPGKDSGNKSSDPLAMEQFLSAFVLLMFGILLAFTLLGFENGYFRFAKKRMYKKSKKPCCCGCCSLISVVSFYPKL